jgi:hypothetical protein
MSRIGIAAVATLVACGTGDGSRGAQPPVADTAGSATVAAPSESLAAKGPGVEIWFTLARQGSMPDGKPCVDRAIELRRDGKRIPIPLLYTEEAPSIVNDTTARAGVYTNCTAGDPYLVDLRSGRPTREKR